MEEKEKIKLFIDVTDSIRDEHKQTTKMKQTHILAFLQKTDARNNDKIYSFVEFSNQFARYVASNKNSFLDDAVVAFNYWDELTLNEKTQITKQFINDTTPQTNAKLEEK